MVEQRHETTHDSYGLAVVLLVGLAVRFGLFTHSGYVTDTQIFEGWAERGGTYGVLSMYNRALPGPLPDYPPLLLYVYSFVGWVVHAIQGSYEHTKTFAAAIKAPGIIADVLTFFALIKAGERLLTRHHGVLAGALFLLLPASWLDSTIWGQYDAIYSLLLFAAFFFIGEKRTALAGVAAGLAFAAKFQVIAFLPFLLLVAASSGWKDVRRGLIAFTIAVIAVFLPFIVSGHTNEVVYAYTHAVGAYGVLSVDAFNIWRIVFGADARNLSDTVEVAGLPYRTWGALFYLVALAVTARAAWVRLRNLEERERTLFVLNTGAVAAFVFFLFPTEIHERYLFAFLPLAALWGSMSRSKIFLYIGISIVIAFNIALVLPIESVRPIYESSGVLDRFLAGILVVLASIAAWLMLWRTSMSGVHDVSSRNPLSQTLQRAGIRS
ncbi:MAG TPA: glycosyltransferase 87 family protein [Gemmatimonadaceae bacterium]